MLIFYLSQLPVGFYMIKKNHCANIERERRRRQRQTPSDDFSDYFFGRGPPQHTYVDKYNSNTSEVLLHRSCTIFFSFVFYSIIYRISGVWTKKDPFEYTSKNLEKGQVKLYELS